MVWFGKEMLANRGYVPASNQTVVTKQFDMYVAQYVKHANHSDTHHCITCPTHNTGPNTITHRPTVALSHAVARSHAVGLAGGLTSSTGGAAGTPALAPAAPPPAAAPTRRWGAARAVVCGPLAPLGVPARQRLVKRI